MASPPAKPSRGGGCVASRTQIVCLHEGTRRSSIDPIFINGLLKALRPSWIRQWDGSNVVRLVPCGGRTDVIHAMPRELKTRLAAGADTTLMVWADIDHDMADGEALKAEFWIAAQAQGITREEFEQVVFVFAKDRLENWIEYLVSGKTDESKEGLRLRHGRQAADAAKRLADACRGGGGLDDAPPSLAWSCRNWRTLVNRMRQP
jgi:hypothetical protein